MQRELLLQLLYTSGYTHFAEKLGNCKQAEIHPVILNREYFLHLYKSRLEWLNSLGDGALGLAEAITGIEKSSAQNVKPVVVYLTDIAFMAFINEQDTLLFGVYEVTDNGNVRSFLIKENEII